MHTLSATRNAERTLQQSPMCMCEKDTRFSYKDKTSLMN